MSTGAAQVPDHELLARAALEQLQYDKLRAQLAVVLDSNPFYRAKLHAAGIRAATDVRGPDDLARLPLTAKQELSADQQRHPPYGTNCSLPPEAYSRLHQTSGTTGERMRWLDTPDSWDWWGQCWQAVYRGAGVNPGDRVFFAFSFGPFIGFWSAHEGASQLGAMAIAGGGMSSAQRVEAILANEATVLVCTPTYALHLAEVARHHGMDIAGSAVRRTIHAGEPGASLPATKRKIELAWGARCFDHAGATEVGAWGFECESQDGLHLNESEFICEVLDPDTGQPGQEGELVITNLGRWGMPVIRYRTGDRVRWHAAGRCACGRTYRKLAGGVIGRLDDVLIIRGVNIYPSTIESLVRQFGQIGEYAVEVTRQGVMDELVVRVEVDGDGDAVGGAELTAPVERALHAHLGIRARVEVTAPGALPRFELKARRVTDRRPSPA